jgi:thiol-disulfide isomerase/thioredoxin
VTPARLISHVVSPDDAPRLPADRFPPGVVATVRSTAVASRRLPLPWLIGATVLVLVAAVAVVALGGDDSPVATPTEVRALAVEPLTGGEPQQLGDLLGERPVVLNLFASWCQPCIEEMPAFERVHEDLGDDVAFVGLAVRNPPDKALGIVEQTGVTYPTFGDTADAASEMFDVVNMPTTVFLAADGTVEDVHTGAFSEDELRSAIGDRLGVGP